MTHVEPTPESRRDEPIGAAERPRRPIERYDLTHPAVPGPLDGLTILHVSDLHAKHTWSEHLSAGRLPPRSAAAKLASALPTLPVDLVIFGGDAADHPGDEDAAIAALALLSRQWQPRLGAYGILGNHDPPIFTRRLPAELPQITWLFNDHTDIEIPTAQGSQTLRLLGISEPEDLVDLTLRTANTRPADLTILLAHQPTYLWPASELVGSAAIPIVLAGHTHGGQIRFGPSNIPHASCDLPKHLASGVIRRKQSICAISRGLGTTFVPIRINSPAQAPLYTLRHGPLPPPRTQGADADQLIPW